MIRSPFNFIQLSDKVFFPEWANQISHDVPFIDWFSGVISLNITAVSPVFVRNGYTQEDAGNKYPVNRDNPYHSFSKINERYFIPGTSIKGAVRNVLSIISYGKIRVDRNMKFAQREWYNNTLYPLKKQQNNLLCGWLKWNKDVGYYIENHGKPYRIAHTRLDEYFQSQGVPMKNLFRENFSSESGFDLNSEHEFEGTSYDPKTASYKYALVNGVNLYDLNFEIDDKYANEYKTNRVKVVLDESRNSFKGCLVFTGQPNSWVLPRPTTPNSSSGKFYDFVFRNSVGRTEVFKLTDDDFYKYESIYENNSDWKRWKLKIYSSGVPVFFRLENNKLKDWGLAFLYKLPYERTPFETLPLAHQSLDLDLTDCIFGTVSRDSSLKGRVSFGHAFCTDNSPMVDTDGVRLILSSPKASYYPIYIEQRGKNGIVNQYETYNDGQIAGWKRYPIRNGVWGVKTGSDLLDSVIYPMGIGSHFVSKVRFFNLNTFELGALLSALTFHDNEDRAYFQLGQGRPYGYGKVKINVHIDYLEGRFSSILKNADTSKILMAYYEDQMQLKDFCLQNSLSKLLPMVSCDISGYNFEYMAMSNISDKNEFLKEKKNRAYLKPFVGLYNAKYHSLYIKYSNVVDNLKNQILESCDNQKAKRSIEKANEEKLIKEENARKVEETHIKEQQRQQKVDSLIQEGDELKLIQKYEQAAEKYEEAYSIIKTIELEQMIIECRNKLLIQQQPIDNFIITTISSIPAYVNNIQKWLKLNSRDLSDNEKQKLIDNVLNSYRKLNRSSKKKWEKSFVELKKKFNIDMSTILMTTDNADINDKHQV